MPQVHVAFQPPEGLTPAVLSGSSYDRLWQAPKRASIDLKAWAVCRSDAIGLRLRRLGGPPGAWRTLQRPTMHIYRPGTYEEDYQDILGRHCAGTYLIFRAPDGLLERFLDGDGIAAVADPKGLLRDALLHGFPSGAADLWRCQAALAMTIGLLQTATRDPAGEWTVLPPARHGPPSLAQQVDAFLREHLEHRVTLAGLARHLGLGTSTLSHRYRAETGCTPLDRLARLRTETARTLLLRGDRLPEVARACGFCDQFHLSRVFTKVTGQSPSAFLAAATAG